MGADQEFDRSIETTVEQKNGCWQGFGDEEADDETLSLCDLVISSDASDYWNDELSKEDPQSASNSSSYSSSSDDQDLFEFFSQDFSASATATSASIYSGNNNDIIFCGKLIPYKGKQQSNIEEQKPQSLKSKVKKQEHGEKNTDTSSGFPWKTMSRSFNKSRTYPPSSSAKASSKTKSLNKSLSLPVVGENKKLGDEKFDFSVKKVSVLATPVKSRWYLFAFGVGRFPMEIELKDMKMRQSRKCKAMKLQQEDDGERGNVKNNKKQRKSGKGLWRLLKVLGWKNRHTCINAAV